MEKFLDYIKTIHPSLLFKDIDEISLLDFLNYLNPTIKKYSKEQAVLHHGETISSFCLLLSGKVRVQKEDFWGNRNILTNINPGDVFAEVFASVPYAKVLVDVVAEEPSTILFLNAAKILKGSECKKISSIQNQVTYNLLTTIAQKNLFINSKLSHLSQRTTREKLLDYFWTESQKQNSLKISLPFNRQKLADYLAVDRSALSKELGKMQKDKLLQYHKNIIVLERE